MTLDEKKELVEEAERMLLLSHSVISSMAGDAERIECSLDDAPDDYTRALCQNAMELCKMRTRQLDNYMTAYQDILRKLAKG